MPIHINFTHLHSTTEKFKILRMILSNWYSFINCRANLVHSLFYMIWSFALWIEIGQIIQVRYWKIARKNNELFQLCFYVRAMSEDFGRLKLKCIIRILKTNQPYCGVAQKFTCLWSFEPNFVEMDFLQILVSIKQLTSNR